MTGYNGSTQTDGYDGDGLRTWKQAASVKTYFLYDGSEPVCEYNGSGTLTATSTFGADGLVSRRTSATAFYLFDERGSVAQRTTSTGSVASSDLYDAFGTRSSTGGADPFGYGAQAGYYTDSETGLVLCTHRYFDPSTGRWLTRDPMGYGGGVNLYGYVGNDPGNEEDPDGTQAVLVPVGVGIAGAALLLYLWLLQHGYHPGPVYWNPPWSSPLPPIVATPPMSAPPMRSDGPPADWPNTQDKIPGGPWTWNPNPTNDRTGVYRGPVAKGPSGKADKPVLTWGKNPRPKGDGSPEDAGYWKCNRPGQKDPDKYDENGDPLPSDHQGHSPAGGR